MSRCGSQWVSGRTWSISVKYLTPFVFPSIAVPDFDAVEKFNVSQAYAYTDLVGYIVVIYLRSG